MRGDGFMWGYTAANSSPVDRFDASFASVMGLMEDVVSPLSNS